MAEVPDRPQRTAATCEAYTRRYQQLIARAKREAAKQGDLDAADVEITPDALASFLIERKSSYAASSWRQYRSAVIHSFEQIAGADPAYAGQIGAAIARLNAERPAPDPFRPVMTARRKAKACPDDDAERIRHAVLATSAPSRQHLVAFGNVNRVAGLRPIEWAQADFQPSDRPGFAWQLKVANAKATNGRAHGPFRTLYWTDLPPDLVNDMVAWIEIAHQGGYVRLLGTIGKLLRKVTGELFPRRKKRPTLATMRHEAVARWKAHYFREGQSDEERRHALATIAAMMGHVSDATANQHYARARAGRRKFPIAAADPAEVARVRQMMDLHWTDKLVTKPRSPRR